MTDLPPGERRYRVYDDGADVLGGPAEASELEALLGLVRLRKGGRPLARLEDLAPGGCCHGDFYYGGERSTYLVVRSR